MPIYAYECQDCGVRFERRQGFSDDPVTVCPECEGSVHRLIQPAGIIFRGSGFYVTDNKSSKNPAAPGRTSKDKAETKSDTSADSTPSSSSASSAGTDD